MDVSKGVEVAVFGSCGMKSPPFMAMAHEGSQRETTRRLSRYQMLTQRGDYYLAGGRKTRMKCKPPSLNAHGESYRVYLILGAQ